jgi:hypothetical protein
VEDTNTEVAVDPFTREAEQKVVLPSYRYRDAELRVIWQTSVPKDDEAALAYFHTVSRFSKDHKPVYCERLDRDEQGHETPTMLREIFDPDNYTTKPFEL